VSAGSAASADSGFHQAASEDMSTGRGPHLVPRVHRLVDSTDTDYLPHAGLYRNVGGRWSDGRIRQSVTPSLPMRFTRHSPLRAQKTQSSRKQRTTSASQNVTTEPQVSVATVMSTRSVPDNTSVDSVSSTHTNLCYISNTNSETTLTEVCLGCRGDCSDDKCLTRQAKMMQIDMVESENGNQREQSADKRSSIFKDANSNEILCIKPSASYQEALKSVTQPVRPLNVSDSTESDKDADVDISGNL
jgi:hypothetical protein